MQHTCNINFILHVCCRMGEMICKHNIWGWLHLLICTMCASYQELVQVSSVFVYMTDGQTEKKEEKKISLNCFNKEYLMCASLLVTSLLIKSMWSVLSRMARLSTVVALSKSVLKTFMKQAFLWEDFLPDRGYFLADRLNVVRVVEDFQPVRGFNIVKVCSEHLK